jgi:hypothetical protein
MRNASVARLTLALVLLGLSMTAVPSHAYPYCPSGPSCRQYILQCGEYNGYAEFEQHGYCQDDSPYLWPYGFVYCTSPPDSGARMEFGDCADRGPLWPE